MAFGKGQASTEGVSIKRYAGIAPCYILAINPDEKKAAELLGYEAPVAPYVTETEVDGKKVKNVRLDFIVRTDKEKCGVEVTSKLTYFLQKTYHQGSQSGKYEIVDKYGRFGWATKEEIQGKQIPMYSNGPANIAEGYRPAYTGEAEITDLIIKYLGIPNVQKWNNKTKKFEGLIDNPSDAEARLDKIEDLFNGNFKELNTILSYQPDNKVKLLWGVRTVEKDGQTRTYQAIYNRMVLSNRTTDYTKIAEEIASRKNSGGLKDTDYPICDFKEYTVEATDFTATAPATPANDPFGDTPAVSSTSDLPWGN